MNEFESISKLTGNTPNECSCPSCVKMCLRCPCLGTPNDILRLINNGYSDSVVATMWAAGLVSPYQSLPPIPMVQLKQEEDGRCTLFQDGKCSIHLLGIKPTEGVLANCSPHPSKIPLSTVVAFSWLKQENMPVIELIVKALKKHGDTTTHTEKQKEGV